MGVPTKRTDATRTTILRALRHGATYKRAAEAAGIHRDTLHEWMRTDPDFSDAVKKAHGQMMQTALASIEKAAREGTWQAAAWWLERMYPDEYGRTIQEQRGEVTHKLVIEYVDDWRGKQPAIASTMIESSVEPDASDDSDAE